MSPEEIRLVNAALQLARHLPVEDAPGPVTDFLEAVAAMPDGYEPTPDLMATATMPEGVEFSLEELAEAHGGTMHEIVLEDAQAASNRESANLQAEHYRDRQAPHVPSIDPDEPH